MKKVFLVILIIFLALLSQGQSVFPKGVKIGKVKTGTSIITVDSITQYSTGDVRFWKGSQQLSPNLVEGFKIGATAITTSATELNYVDGVTSTIQTQLNTRPTFQQWADSSETAYSNNQVDSIVSN